MLGKLFRKRDPFDARCAFCGKFHSEVARLIAGNNCYICNECVMVCFEILTRELGAGLDAQYEKAVKIAQGARTGELEWLKNQHQRGLLSEEVYLERQKELVQRSEGPNRVPD